MIIAFFLFLPVSVFAGANVSFAWDYEDPAPADLGYFILQQKDGTAWVDVLPNIDKDARTCTLFDVEDGIYVWRMLAADLEDQRSGPSNEVTETIDEEPLPAPHNFRHVTTITLEIRGGQIVAHNYRSEILPIK